MGAEPPMAASRSTAASIRTDVTLPSTYFLGAMFGGSELALSLLRRAASGAAADDRGTLRWLWVVILLSLAAAYVVTVAMPGAGFAASQPTYAAGVGVFAAGLMLRWYSILYLGKLFTVNVAISVEHRVVETGPFRFIRHPSYAGALLAFLGFGVCLRNFAALAVIMIPVTLVFLHRIRIEETVLSGALGENYRRYMSHTRRLIPGIY